MRLTAAGREGLSNGEVTNLVANDAQKLFEVTLNAHLVWSSPLQIAVVCALLIEYTGPTALIGVGCLVGVLPLAKVIVKRMLELRTKRLALTDERVRISGEVLGGIRVTKLNGWEPLWQKRLEDVRGQEVWLTRKELFVFGITMIIMVTSPVLAVLATISARMLIDSAARLTPADTFATIGLIACLRFPINRLGELLGQLSNALRSTQRIAAFLARETMPREGGEARGGGGGGAEGKEGGAVVVGLKEEEEEVEEDDLLLRVDGASFRVGAVGADGSSSSSSNSSSSDNKSSSNNNDGTSDQGSDAERGSSFTVRGVGLAVGPGELVAVVGPVACGKSTLLAGILGNAAVDAGTVRIGGQKKKKRRRKKRRRRRWRWRRCRWRRRRRRHERWCEPRVRSAGALHPQRDGAGERAFRPPLRRGALPPRPGSDLPPRGSQAAPRGGPDGDRRARRDPQRGAEEPRRHGSLRLRRPTE